MKNEKRQKAFTLVELLVVITIIGTLSGIVLVSLSGARSRARDAIRQSDIRQLVSAQGIYYGFNDGYYTSVPPGEGGSPSIGRYLSPMHDPRCPGSECVDYVWRTNTGDLNCDSSQLDSEAGEWFCVYAVMEEKSTDPNNTIYFCASHRGTKKVELGLGETPSVSGSCTCF
jgi:prepilin-type N-terminal cleavage/methylation domain-containing protein